MKRVIIILFALMAIFIVAIYLSVSETKDHFRTCAILSFNDIEKIDFKDFDSVIVAANTLYEANFLKEVMQGEQYRDVWAAPITVPIAFLDTLNGGLTVVEEGGGKQTHSLELKDNQGIRYALRSLSKDPEKLVPEIAKQLGLENIVVDGVSAQHPYAALVVSELSEAVEILHTQPRLLFLPKQDTFGQLNAKYSNRLYFFEYESEGKVNWTGFENVKELVDTDNLIQLKMEWGDSIKINRKALIRARLFDLLIGDWDRHAKQWGWALRESNGKLIAEPVPTDRDNAFFKLEGILPTLIANNALHPQLQTFEGDIDFLPGLVTTFDEYFLRSATMEEFKNEARNLRTLMNDSILTDSFLVWPKAIEKLNGPEIREKIQGRRENLEDIAVQFYGLLQRRPKKNIVLKGCEELKLTGPMTSCFDCKEEDYNFREFAQ